jgi:HEAT repeat protein
MTAWLKRRHSSADGEDVIAVTEALGRLGADAEVGAETLRSMLKTDSWGSKRQVAIALALFRIRGDKDLAFPILREELQKPEVRSSIYYSFDMSDTTRVHAVRALGILVENGDERAAALIAETAKGDENPHVRKAALEAMARQEQTNATAMKDLCAMLRHPDVAVRFQAASACGRLGSQANLALESLKLADS